MGCTSSKGRHRAAKRNGGDQVGYGKGGKEYPGINCGGGGARPAQANGQGIAAFHSNDGTAATFLRNIERLRSVAVAEGVLPASPGEGNSMVGSMDSDTNDSQAPVAVEAAKIPTYTVYQCQPLPGDTTLAKGMFSTLHLASLSVFTVYPGVMTDVTVPRSIPRRRGEADSLGNASPVSPAGVGPPPEIRVGSPGHEVLGSASPNKSVPVCFAAGRVTLPSALTNSYADPHHYLIAMKEVVLYTNSGATSVLDQVELEVRRWTRLSGYTARVIRCYQLEYVLEDGVTCPVPKACYDFFGEVDNTNGSSSGSPFSGGSPHGERRPLLRGGGSNFFRKLTVGRGGSSSVTAPSVDGRGAPHQLRLYLEYAQYGTLRGFQLREMPERFQQRRLHELTARAYMRDVLLALLQLHEAGELQYDLCAKAVFLHKPIQNVYGSFFPAYISDLPTGDLTSVTASQLGKALSVLNPPPPPQSPLPFPTNGKAAVQWLNDPLNEPISGEFGAPLLQRNDEQMQEKVLRSTWDALPGNSVSAEARFTGRASMPLDDTSCAPHIMSYTDTQNAALQDEIVLATNNECRNGNTKGRGVDARNRKPNGAAPFHNRVKAAPADGSPQRKPEKSADESSRPVMVPSNGGGSPSPGSGAPFPQVADDGSAECTTGTADLDGDTPADHPRFHAVYCRYLDEYDFRRVEGDDGAPFPSPHDGVRGQVDAELLMPIALAEEARMPLMRVAPLQGSSRGGIVMSYSDGYEVKMGEAPKWDLSGSLPLLLMPPRPRVLPKCDVPPSTRPLTSDVTSSTTYASFRSRESGPLTAAPPATTRTAPVTAAGPLGRARGSAPLVKLNHASLLRRALCYGDADKLEDIAVHRYITVTHAAPEVLHRRTFSPASDIYAFAMTFVELVSDDGMIMEDCLPTDLPKPVTRREKEAYDTRLTENLDKWYQARISALRENFEAAKQEQELPAAVSPRTDPVVVRLPQHLSDECKNVLRACLQADPRKRPTAAELLRSRYFMLGNWIAAPTGDAVTKGAARLPEAPWSTAVNFNDAATAVGLPPLRAPWAAA